MSLPLNKVILGDCVEVMVEWPDNSIDCIIVDPPYASSLGKRFRPMRSKRLKWFSHDRMSTTGYVWFLRLMLNVLRPKLKPGASGYMFIDWKQYPTISGVIESTGYKLNDLLVWDKLHFGTGYPYRSQHELISFFSKDKPIKMNRHDVPNILKIKPVPSSKRVHPVQKPVKLLEKIIEVSTDKGDVVLDPMCGSGSTLVASKRLFRNFIGIDVNPEYVEVALSRVEPIRSLAPFLEAES